MADEPKPAAEVFISYKSEDRSRVLELRDEFEKRGLSTWMDVSGILGGEYYAKVIIPAIRGSKVFLLMCTRNALASPNIVEEVESAHQFKIPMIPLRLENYEIPDSLHLHLGTLQHIDLVDRPLEKWLPDVLAALTKHDLRIQPQGAKRIFGSLPHRLVDCFQGRTEELRRLRQKLDKPTVRLVLVSGPQGAGKTALVMSFVKTQSEPGTVIYLSLKESSALDSLAALLSETLPPKASDQWREKWKDQSSLSDKFEFLFRSLVTERLWIVLDDLEKVLTGSGAIAPEWMACIEPCLANDHQAQVIGLANEDPKFSPEFEAEYGTRRARLPFDKGLDDASGIALLKALEGDELLGIRDSSDDFLGNLVRRCGGHPDSLKMLFGYIVSQRETLREFAADDEAFARFLKRPVQAVYDNLSAAEREVVRALAVYDAPTSKEAIKHTLNRSLSAELDILDRRYVVYGRTPSIQLYPRYQQYAYEEIAREERPALHGTAAEWFRRQCKKAEEIETLADVEPYVSRCHHLMRAGRAAEAEELLYGVEEIMMQRGFAGRVAAIRAQLIDLLQEPEQRGRNFRCAGLALSELGEHQEALHRYTQSLEIGVATDDLEMQSAALISMGWANNALGFHDEAHKQLARARETIPDSNRSTRAIGALIGNMGDAALHLGRIDEGIELTRQALELHDGYPAGKAVWLGNLGFAYQCLGKVADAIKYFKEAVTIDEQQNLSHRRRVDLCRLGRAYLDDNCITDALSRYQEANRQASDIADKPAQSLAFFGIGAVEHENGDRDAARRNYESALAIAGERTSHHCHNRLGILCLQEGRHSDARLQFDRAVEICNGLFARGSAFDPLYQLALAHLGNASRDALTWYSRAVEQCNARGVILTALRDLRLLLRAADTGDVREAIALLERAN